MQTKAFYPKPMYFSLFLHLLWGGGACHGACVDSRGQTADAASFFLPCGPQGLNSGHQLWWQVTLHNEACCQPIVAHTYPFLSPTAVCLRTLHVQLPFLGALKHEASSAPWKGDLSPRNALSKPIPIYHCNLPVIHLC